MANLGQEGRKDRLQMSKTDNLRQQGSKDRLEDGFKTANLDQKGSKKRVEMVSRQATCA